jgi:hypothetical protein
MHLNDSSYHIRGNTGLTVLLTIMKLSVLLSAAAAAVTTAFVVPNEQILQTIVQVDGQSSSLPPKDSVENTLDALWHSDAGTGFEGFAGSGDIDVSRRHLPSHRPIAWRSS